MELREGRWARVAAAACVVVAAAVGEARAFRIASPEFEDGGRMHPRFTADGANDSPTLHWSGAPAGTQSYALVMVDPDAPGERPFVHWVLYDIPAQLTRLPTAIAKGEAVAGGRKSGVNDFGLLGYRGPQPPRGSGTHRYQFTLYALSVTTVGLEPRATKAELDAAIAGKVLAASTLVGTYSRE